MTLLKVRNNGGLKNLFETRPMFTDMFSEMFDNFLPAAELRNSIPAVNIKETENEFIVSLAAPGLAKEDFKVKVEEDVLSISTEKTEEKNENNERFTRKEFSFTSFKRAFTLPENVDATKINATYENGILNIALPKQEVAKAKPVQEIVIK